ncbi:MAG: hypothetical protein K0R28_330 [Paenibacillus sp.]|nr:hypothetical protein [Paenibacillus sp.]
MSGQTDTKSVTVTAAPGWGWNVAENSEYTFGWSTDISTLVHNGTPYAAYSDTRNGEKAKVVKYTENGWQPVGGGAVSDGRAGSVSLAAYNGALYVAYRDQSISPQRMTVMKYDGGSWEPAGSKGLTLSYVNSVSLAADEGTPYVAYLNSNNATAVMMYWSGYGD